MKRKLKFTTLLAAVAALQLLLGGTSLAANGEQNWVQGDEYQAGDFGRVLYSENGVTLIRAAHDPGSAPAMEASVNSPVFPGDSLQTGYDQRVEVQLARGSLVRVDRASEITFLALPDPYADFQDNTVLQVVEGTIQITSFVDDREEFRIDTPASSVYLLGDGDFRIEVSSQGRTRVVSQRGVAEVVGNGGSVLVRGGMLAEVYPGSVPGTPEPFNTFLTDSFDRWIDDREASRRVRDRYAGNAGYSADVYEEIPVEVQPYYAELSRHGRWVNVVDYGYVWHPVGVSATWRPYYDGYWDYGPSGYFWVSHEPWGWAPYHYGRWNWVAGYGWCWIPGRVFGGAWVAWSWGSVHVGWAALDYWNRPCFYGPTYYGYYDPYAWTFVHYDHFHHRHYPRYAVPLTRIRDHVSRHAVVTRPPRVSPRRLADSSELRDRVRRQASADGRGRLNPIDRDRRPQRTLRDVDRGLRGRVAQARAGQRLDQGRGRDGGIGGGRRSEAGSRARPESAARPGGTRSLAGNGNTRANTGRTVTYPRRITSPEAEGLRRAARSGTRSRAGAQDGTPSRSQTRGRATVGRDGGSNERRGDLYRRMASPRTTQERSRAPEATGDRSSATARSRTGSKPGNSTARGSSSRSQGARSQGARSQGSRSQGSRSQGARSQGSRSGASSGRSGSGSGKQPARSSGSSSRSGSGRKKPEVGMRRSVPSRGKPSGSTVRSGSGSRRSSPSSARRSTPSRGKPSGSTIRSGSGSRRSSPSSARRSTPSRGKPSGSTIRSGSGSRRSSPSSARRSTPSRGKPSGSSARSRSGGSRPKSSSARSGSSRSSGSRSSGRSSGSRGGRRGKK